MDITPVGKTFDGKDLYKLNISGTEQEFFLSEDGRFVRYDSSMNEITYGGFNREELKKLILSISDGRYLGFHEYKIKDDGSGSIYRAIVVWVKRRGEWTITMKRGIADLHISDMDILKKGIEKIGW